MPRPIVAALFVALLSCPACTEGGNDDGGAGASDEPTPVEKCQDYASTWCNKSLGCYVKLGHLDESELQSNVDDCVQIVEKSASCSDVTSTSDDYPTCIKQVNGMACSSWDVAQIDFGTVRAPASCGTSFLH
jgi:hypothetical protein